MYFKRVMGYLKKMAELFMGWVGGREGLCVCLCVFFWGGMTQAANDVMSDCVLNAACKLSVFSPGH